MGPRELVLHHLLHARNVWWLNELQGQGQAHASAHTRQHQRLAPFRNFDHVPQLAAAVRKVTSRAVDAPDAIGDSGAHLRFPQIRQRSELGDTVRKGTSRPTFAKSLQEKRAQLRLPKDERGDAPHGLLGVVAVRGRLGHLGGAGPVPRPRSGPAA